MYIFSLKNIYYHYHDSIFFFGVTSRHTKPQNQEKVITSNTLLSVCYNLDLCLRNQTLWIAGPFQYLTTGTEHPSVNVLI